MSKDVVVDLQVGEHRFKAEGPSELVSAQFELFRSLVEMATGSAKTTPATKPQSATPKQPRLFPKHGLQAQSSVSPLSAASGDFKELFLSDPKKQVVRLKSQPAELSLSDDDAVLLVLLAHKELYGVQSLRVMPIKVALGYHKREDKRLDRIMAAPLSLGLVRREGVGRGGIYTLLEPGVSRAKEKLDEINKISQER